MKTPPSPRRATSAAARAAGRSASARQQAQADRARADQAMQQIAQLRRYGYATQAQIDHAAQVYAATRVAMAKKGARP